MHTRRGLAWPDAEPLKFPDRKIRVDFAQPLTLRFEL
jgi:hypothetical protein